MEKRTHEQIMADMQQLNQRLTELSIRIQCENIQFQLDMLNIEAERTLRQIERLNAKLANY